MNNSLVDTMDLTVRRYISGMQHCLQNCRICPRKNDDGECEFLTVRRIINASAETCIETNMLYATGAC